MEEPRRRRGRDFLRVARFGLGTVGRCVGLGLVCLCRVCLRFVGFGVGFAQYWKVGLQYIVFLSPPGAFRQERNLELAGSFDDGALTGSAFSVNPYVKVFYAISGDSTVVVGKQGGTYDVEIGILPALALKKINGVPLTITAPTWVTVGPTSYWNNGATGCGTVATAP